MKKQLFFSLFIIQVLFAAAQSKEPYLVKSLSGEHINFAEVQTSGGSISAQGDDANARIEVYITSNNGRQLSKEDIQKRLDENYTLDITASNGKLTAFARQKNKMSGWKNGLSISFRLYIPKNSSTHISTSGGSISMTNLAGTEEFTTSGGSLSVDRVNGKIKGTTSGGSITVQHSSDDINLSTSGGSIEASECMGKVHLSTSGGSLSLHHLNGDIDASTSGGGIDGGNIEGELKANTSGGSIDLKDLACSLETGTSGGSIDVSMKEVGKYVRISNSGGSVHLQLPEGKGYDLDIAARKIHTSSLSNFSGNMKEDEIEGKLNGGGIPVKVHGSGSLTLTIAK